MRWSVPFGLGLLGVGFLASAAGALELLSNRNLKPGWTRYQPPWTVPVFVVGLVLVFLGLGILAASAISLKRQRKGG
jgi:hypothetical protein